MPDDKQLIETYLSNLVQEQQSAPREQVLQMIDVLSKARAEKKHIFTFGNGGSSATADIMGVAFQKGVLRDSPLPGRQNLRFISLTANMPVFSAWANDSAYDVVFSEQLKSLADAGDVAIGISASGNSPNVLNGFKTAREMGLTTIGLTGFQGGKMKELCDICYVHPSNDMERIEDAALIVNHLLLHALRQA